MWTGKSLNRMQEKNSVPNARITHYAITATLCYDQYAFMDHSLIHGPEDPHGVNQPIE
jgi:hypothetical protein